MPNSVTSASMVAKSIWTEGLLWPVREANIFDAYANLKSTSERGQRGKEVIFEYINPLATAPKQLDEIVGPEAKTFNTVTDSARMQEYGNTVEYTALAKYTATNLPVQETLTKLLGINASDTMDEIALGALTAEFANGPVKQIVNSKATEGAITKTDTLKTIDLEIAYTEMMAQSVPTFAGNYKAFISPYQAHDLRNEIGAGGWRVARENGGLSGEALKTHEVGEWAGFDLIVTNKLPVTATGSGTGANQTKVTKAVAMGSDGFVKVYSDHPEGPGSMPEIRLADPIDALQRVFRISWYGLFGYKIMRAAGIRQIVTGTSRG